MSVSIAELVGSKALQKYHKIVTYIVTFALLCSLWLGVGVIRVAAADNPVSFTLSGGSLHVGTNSFGVFYENNYDDILIPVYCYLSGDNSNVYLNGVYNVSVSPFSFRCSDNTNASVLYFEAVNYEGLTVRYTNGSINLFFDDFFFKNGLSYPVGYFHLSVNTTAASTMIYTNSSYDRVFTLGTSYTYASTFEYGLENAVIAAINDSSDINTIILYLLNIQNNTALLDYIIDYLANNRNLTEIYNQLVNLNATETLLYNEIYNYLHQSNAGANAASQAASELGSEAANQGNIEESLVALAPGNISDLDSADAFGVLDDIQLSTAFWVDAVHQFSIESGILWGIFIFALIIGLIAFILRLR